MQAKGSRTSAMVMSSWPFHGNMSINGGDRRNKLRKSVTPAAVAAAAVFAGYGPPAAVCHLRRRTAKCWHKLQTARRYCLQDPFCGSAGFIWQVLGGRKCTCDAVTTAYNHQGQMAGWVRMRIVQYTGNPVMSWNTAPEAAHMPAVTLRASSVSPAFAAAAASGVPGS